MKFTYGAYERLLESLTEHGYCFRDYMNWNTVERSVILRHDLDNNLSKAVRFSEIEKKICGGGATYFVLLATEFYNVASLQSRREIDKILTNGGQIGLHFDETQYEIATEQDMTACVEHETELLSKILGIPVKTVSMHRPSRLFLDADMEFPGICNTYANCFFKDMKYLSDSRRYWREDVENIVSESGYARLNILTHPIWYNEKEDADIRETLMHTIEQAYMAYYDNLHENITDLQDIITRKEIERKIED